jgi:hypothetical protein
MKLANKKRLIVKKGGFLLPLLTAVLTTLVTLLLLSHPGRNDIMLRKMHVVPASAPKRSIKNPRPSIFDDGAGTQQLKAQTKIQKRQARNKKSTSE